MISGLSKIAVGLLRSGRATEQNLLEKVREYISEHFPPALIEFDELRDELPGIIIPHAPKVIYPPLSDATEKLTRLVWDGASSQEIEEHMINRGVNEVIRPPQKKPVTGLQQKPKPQQELSKTEVKRFTVWIEPDLKNPQLEKEIEFAFMEWEMRWLTVKYFFLLPLFKLRTYLKSTKWY
jgi:hypothetical protein